MKILTSLNGIFGNLLNIVESVIQNDKEKYRIKEEILNSQTQAITEISNYLKELEIARTKTIVSELTGHSWIQRNWRPVLMLTFIFIIIWNYILAPLLNIRTVQTPDQMWNLIKIGIGGYLGGRSFEKIISMIQGGNNGNRNYQ